MTVAVATPAGVWADRRVSGDGSGPRSVRKVFRCGDAASASRMTVAAAGLLRTIGAIGRRRKSLEKPEDLLPIVGAHSTALVVYDGAVWVVEDGFVWRCPEPYYAIGTGADAARGFLAGRGGAPTPDDVRDAVRCAGRIRPGDCGGGVDFEPAG